MNDIQDNVLANILSRLPFDKHKVGMQGLNKQWLRVLHTSVAYSTDTEDCWIPSIPAPNPGSMISPRVLAALCKFKLDFGYFERADAEKARKRKIHRIKGILTLS